MFLFALVGAELGALLAFGLAVFVILMESVRRSQKLASAVQVFSADRRTDAKRARMQGIRQWRAFRELQETQIKQGNILAAQQVEIMNLKDRVNHLHPNQHKP